MTTIKCHAAAKPRHAFRRIHRLARARGPLADRFVLCAPPAYKEAIPPPFSADCLRDAGSMWSLKAIVDSAIEDLLEFPVIVIRTHVCVLAHGPRGAFVLEHRLTREPRRYLRLRTIAFIDLLFIYAIVQAINGHTDSFQQNLIVALFQLSHLDPTTKEFLSFLSFFLGAHYTFYFLAMLTKLDFKTQSIIVGACLYYATLSILALFLLWLFFQLGAHGSDFLDKHVFTTPVYRGFLSVIYAIIYWQIGAIFSSRLRLRKFNVPPLISNAAAGLFCFAIYVGVVKLTFGGNIWPTLSM
jgi:hypothetical protein